MNLSLRFSLVSIFFFCFNGLIAQIFYRPGNYLITSDNDTIITSYRPGYVITNDNDTLRGFIDLRRNARNSKKCKYKHSLDSRAAEYLPKDIKGYRFDNGKYYVSKKIVLWKKEQSFFLEYLVNGIADLYYFREDNATDHYFIEKTDGKLFELKNLEEISKRDGKSFLFNYKKYVGLLKIAFEDCPKIFPLIDEAILDQRSLIDITKKYHDYVCTSQECIVYEKQIPNNKSK